jgi:valyl-tRNA synthetase
MQGLSDKRYDPQKTDARWYQVWVERGYFQADVQAPGDPFCIVIPPPNITGSLHMGHALNTTLQDILVRWKRMDGYNTLWLPGTDHAGIATQWVVEQQLAREGTNRHTYGREQFIERVWRWREESGRTIVRQLMRLGASCDWSRERFTMDEGLSRAVRKVFVTLYREGLIYRGDYIIQWCPRCMTALSDLEVEYEEREGKLYYIRYGPLTLATVRPETKLGDTALAVHPEDRRYAKYVDRLLTIPSVEGDITIKVIADGAVDPEFGTGVVKVTPAHDPLDFEIGRRHGLEIRQVIGFDGRMNGAAGKYVGLDRFECRSRIVEDLQALGLISNIEDYKHRLGLCYRCRTVVEPLVSRQWFVRMKSLAEPAIEVVRSGKIRFVPSMWSNTYYEWMLNIRDWCISRQIWWGHRIPAWYCAACDGVTVAETTPTACEHCHGCELRQDEDVLDT